MRIHASFATATFAVGAFATIALAGNGFTITPLILQDDAIEEGVLVTLVESLDVNNGGDWILELGTDAESAFNRVVVINGNIAYRKGFGFDQPKGGLISSFDSVRINGNASVGWNLFFSGSIPSSADSGIFFNDVLLIQESDLSSDTDVLSKGTPYIGFFETRLNDNDQLFAVATVDDPAIASSVDRVLVWLDYDADTETFVESVLWKEGDMLPGQTETATDFGTGTENQAINNAGQALFSVSLTGATATNAALYIDDTLVKQKGDESPIAGRTFTNIGTSTRLDMNSNGDWVFVGNISGDTADNQVIVSNDMVVAQRGTAAPGTDVDINNFGTGPVRIDDNGSVWWYANLTGDASQNAAFYRDGELLIRKGVAVDGFTFTTISGSTATSGITKGFSISPNGQYMIFRGILDNGLRGAFLVTFEGPACDPTADFNGDSTVDGADLGVLLNAWGECPVGAGCPADLNCDGVVDGADLGILLNEWSE